MAKIYVYQGGDITTAAIEGAAEDLHKGVKKYPKMQKLKTFVDFSPIFHERDNRLFLVGNSYFPDVCTIVVYQHTDGRNNNTSITTHGTSEAIALNMIKDFARVLNFVTVDPSAQLRQEARIAHFPLEALCDRAKIEGLDPRQVFAMALGGRQNLYRMENNMQA